MAKSNINALRKTILPETKEMEAYLQIGYPDMSVEKAKTIIKERRENPALWPYTMVEKAEAFLAAYSSSPIAVSPKAPMQKLEVHNN